MIQAAIRVLVSVWCLHFSAAAPALCAVATSPPPQVPADELPVLNVGRPVEGAIEDDAPVVKLTPFGYDVDHAVVGGTWRVEVEASGAYHVDLTSFLFDSYLVLRDADGTSLAEDDDGGVGVDARLQVELEAGRSYLIQACALHGQRGEYELGLRPGRPADLSPPAQRAVRLDNARRRVEAVEARYGPRAVETAWWLNRLAVVLQEDGDLAGARPLFERALAIQESVLGPEHPDVAVTLKDLGLLLLAEGDPSGARPLFERALAINESVRGPDHPNVAALLDSLATSLKAEGDLSGARPLYERALAITESVLGPEHPMTGAVVGNLGSLLVAQGDLSGARPLYERTLAITESVLGPEHLMTAAKLGHLAGVLDRQGEPSAARRLHERALAIHESVLGPEHPATATSLTNLAGSLRARGDLARARLLYERALAIRESVLGPEHPLTAHSLNGLGLLLQVQGDLSGARLLLERALAIRESVLGPEDLATARTLHNLGALLLAQGDSSAARPLLERALAIRESVLGPERLEIVVSLSALGWLLQVQGDPSGARLVNERALAICESVLGPEHPYTTAALNNLSTLVEAQGDYLGALPLYERSLATSESVLGPDHPGTATIRRNLALLRFDMGQVDAAWKLVVEAAAGRRSSVSRILPTLTEGEALLYLVKSRWYVDFMLTLAEHIEDVGATALAYEALLDWKGRVGRTAMAGRERLLRDVKPQEREWLERLRDVQAVLARSALLAADGDARELDLVALRDKRDDLERRLRREAGESQDELVSVARLRAALPVGSAVVDFFAHRDFEPARWEDGAVVAAGRWSAPRWQAWVTRPEREDVLRVDLGPVEAIDGAIRDFLAELVARRGVALADEPAGPDHGVVLRERLWDPIAAHLDGVTTVFVSPDGAVSTLPLEVLQDADDRYLIEDRAFVYVADAVSLVERLEADATDDSMGALDSLLAVGGVDYRRRAEEGGAGDAPAEPALLAAATSSPADTAALRGSFSSYWGRLPATEYESQVVADMHTDAFFDDGRRLLLQGAEATEGRLKTEMPRHAVLHVATHGFFQPEGLPSMWDAAREAADASAGPQLSELGARLVGMHPGLLSGLVLAGVNRRGTAGDPDDVSGDDGYLTAEELTWLDLSGVELVVLSACETGLGRAASGEGLMGLRRALRIAGADTVISSLWSVKDESTAELMQSFYANLFFEGLGRHEALRAAQLEMLRNNRAREGRGLPSTWGAFVLSGEWR